MNQNERYAGQKGFWEFAGQVGYGEAQFSGPEVERHVVGKQWDRALGVARLMNISPSAKILELGCGDGSFSAQALGPRFKSVDAFDVSNAAIERAKSRCGCKNVNYTARDIVAMSYAEGESWDAAFLMGFLHHVKPFAVSVVERLSQVCPRAIVLEPNGNNLIRKGLELLPSYKKAGEASFRFAELTELFGEYGFEPQVIEKINLVPPFLPAGLLPIMRPLERVVENSRWLGGLCSTTVVGFVKRAP